jgi:hypothetical protein
MEAAEGELGTTKKFLTAKFQIGSCKGPTNYNAQETVFHPDDVPALKKENKAFMKKWKRGGVGPGESPKWDGSSYVDQFVFRRTRVNSDHDRPNMYAYNLRAEHLPPKNLEHIPKPHKFKIDVMSDERKAAIRAAKAADPVLAGKATNSEMPVNRKLLGKTSWNSSSYTEDHERAARAKAEDGKAKRNSRRANRKLASYIPPQKLPLPTAPPPVKPEESDAEFTGKPSLFTRPRDPAPSASFNRMTTRPTEKVRSFQHSGVFEFNGQEGQWMWSDTASFVRESPGDLIKVHNPNAYNFASPTMSL